MDLLQLIAQARSLGREEFSSRHPHLFLLFWADENNIQAAPFETEVAPRGAAALALGGSLRVMPIRKSAGNPYADRISIGRARNCDVVLRHPSVSKLHAHVRKEGDAWVLVDNGSHNGTSVGAAPLTDGKAVPLRPHDLVTFGAVTVRVIDAAELHAVLLRLEAAQRS